MFLQKFKTVYIVFLIQLQCGLHIITYISHLILKLNDKQMSFGYFYYMLFILICLWFLC